MKKLFALILALVMVLSLVACGGGAKEEPKAEEPKAEEPKAEEPKAEVKKVTMKIAGTAAADKSNGEYQLMLMLEELIEEYSEGSIDVELYPANQLGATNEITDGVSMGTIECTITGLSNLGRISSPLYIFAMPYLFDSVDHCIELLMSDSEVAKETQVYLDDVGVNLIGIAARTMRVVANTKQPIKTPADMVGVSFRSPNNSVSIATNEAMGGSPVTVDWSECYTALSSGAVMGVENAITELKSINCQEVVKYVSETNHQYEPVGVLVNQDWFNTLDASQQEAIVKAGKEATDWRLNVSLAEEEEMAWKAFEDAGVEVLYAEDVDIAAFREACGSVAQDYIDQGQFTQEYYQVFLDAIA